jgi:protein-tyrosine sulfotransferase
MGSRMPDLFSVLGYRRRWLFLSLLSKRTISDSAPIVIGGSERSGTTLFRVLLGRHPEIVCGRESTVFLRRISGPQEIGRRFDFDPGVIEQWQRESRSQVEFIERFRAAVLASEGKPIWADKTPPNVSRFRYIRRHFPRARLIHIIRDGRDVVCSLRSQSWARVRGHDRSSPEALRICADHWASRVNSGRQLLGDSGFLEIRYEELVKHPEHVLRRVTDFLGVEWCEEMLVPERQGDDEYELRARSEISESSIGRWRQELSASELELLDRRIGPLLLELGYQADPIWTAYMGPRKPVPGAISPSSAGIPLPRPLAESAGVSLRQSTRLSWHRRALERLPKPLRARLADVHVLYHAAKDRRVPWLARAAASLGIAYFLSPIDLIPDNIPVIGYLDDVTVLWLGMRIAISLSPAGVMAELRAAAAVALGLA